MDELDLIQFHDETDEEQKEGSETLPSAESSSPSLNSEVSSSSGEPIGMAGGVVDQQPDSTSNFDTSYMSGLFQNDSPSPKVGKECILDELLSDIRRSCAVSLASTPTAVISEGEMTDVFFLDCKVRRSDIELRTLAVSELQELVSSLHAEVECASSLLVKLLQAKDRHALKASKLSDKMTTILRNYAKRNKMCRKLSFSLHPPTSEEDYQQWRNAWKVMSRLPRGIPKMWRKEVWEGLLSMSEVSKLDWPSIFSMAFSEYATPTDEALGAQIVKDLHRTGDTGFTSEEEHAVLKRILLAYARFNQSTGYCQGFNILAALILKVVEFDERMALQVMIHIVDYVLPESYFAENLLALSADMATFRELLRHILPELSVHIETLQKEASGMVKKSYSSEDPPDIHSVHAYEPPLADVFSMQWFLTVFAAALPRKAIRQVWDMLLLEGSETLLYTGTAIMAIVENDLLQTATAADFYTTMAELGECLRKSQLLPSSEFMEVIYAVQSCVTMTTPSLSPIPSVKELREKYAYNILPCARPEDDSLAQLLSNARPCPLPQQGGSFAMTNRFKEMNKGANSKRRKKGRAKNNQEEVDGNESGGEVNLAAWSGQKSSALPKEKMVESTLDDQVKMLCEHYFVTSRDPPTIRCNIDLAPPMARVVCPQTKYKSVAGATRQMTGRPYGLDVPDKVVSQSKVLSGYPALETITKSKSKPFVISSDYPSTGETGLEIDGAWLREGNHERRNLSGFEGKSVSFNNTDDITSKKFHKRRQKRMIST